MRPAFWRTLAWRLTLAFALVSAVALGVVGYIAYASTRSQLGALLGEQARTAVLAQAQAYAGQRGTLSGFRPTPQEGSGSDHRGAPRDGPRGDPGEVFGAWLVLDAGRRAVYAMPDVRSGQTVTGRREVPILVAERTVGYLVPSGMQLRPDRRGQEFLDRTLRAIGWAMLGATALAVLMGVLVSGTLLRPLHDLLSRIRALQRGEEPGPSPVRRDEFGTVLTAFDEMHGDVVRSQQARRQLTADIAHDLNTPLSVISGTLEGMRDGTFRVTPERLARLHQETQHMAGLVGDLRFLALADAGELQIHRRAVPVAGLVHDAVTPLQAVAARQGVALETDVRTDGLQAHVDPQRIRQVLHNLLSNALAHTPHGGRVWVSAVPEGELLRLEVRDTGSGIAPEHLPHVFDRLYRVQAARSGGGSGLGLSIVRKIVEAHGGEVGLESQQGVGTTVTVRLPLAA